MSLQILLTVAVSLFSLNLAECQTPFLTKSLAEKLDQDVNPLVAPQGLDGSPIDMGIALYLVDIVHANPDTNEVEMVLWYSLRWRDASLAWDPEAYNGVTHMNLPAEKIWKPDMTIYRALFEPILISPDFVDVRNDGSVMWVPAQRVRIVCDVNEVQTSNSTCGIRIGSWVYTNQQLHLNLFGELEKYIPIYYTSASRYNLFEVSFRQDTQTFVGFGDYYDYIEMVFTFAKK